MWIVCYRYEFPFVNTIMSQARSQGGSLGAEEPNRMFISLLKRFTILLKNP